jgi:hypothetical protein
VLEKLDKVAPYLALLLLGYLCHSAVSPGLPAKSLGKDNPTIGEQALHPELVTPEAHASPVSRDPFEVRWASYREEGSPLPPSQSPAGSTAWATSAPAYNPQDEDEQQGPPPLPSGLKGLLLGNKTQLVVVGDKICKPGDTIPSPFPGRAWVIERVEVDGVVLRYHDIVRKVQMLSADHPEPAPTSAPSEDAEP